MNFEFIWRFMPYLLVGAKNTLYISLVTLVFITILGILGALGRTSNIKPLKYLITAFVEVARNTPEVVQIFFVFFALPRIGVKVPPLTAGLIAVTFFGTGYFIEVFRAGIEAVHKNQIEAAKSLGMTNTQLIIYVVLPQAIKISLPSAVGYLIFILKMSAVLHAIGIVELTFVATDVIATYFHPFEMFFAIAVLYLIMVWGIAWIGSILEKRLTYNF